MKNKIIYALLITLIFSLTLISCAKEESTPSLWDSAAYTESVTLGEGAKTIKVEVKAEEKSVVFTINTDAQYLGEALTEHSLVSGDNTEFGLYIKSVNGMKAEYESDGYYWSLEKGGEYLMTGVDTTEIADGEEYALIRTK